jgi:hypothetical protein
LDDSITAEPINVILPVMRASQVARSMAQVMGYNRPVAQFADAVVKALSGNRKSPSGITGSLCQNQMSPIAFAQYSLLTLVVALLTRLNQGGKFSIRMMAEVLPFVKAKYAPAAAFKSSVCLWP